MRRIKGIYAALLLGILTSCLSAKENKTNVESWIHLFPRDLKLYFVEAKEFGKHAKEQGYTAIVIRFTTQRGYDKETAKKLIKYYKDLGLKVIPEFKLLGKSRKTYGTKFLEQHPELFEGEILDPYAVYQGKPAFDSLIIPMVDEHIEVFDNPEYILLGWDEYNTDNIKKTADKNGKTISDIWAGTLNRVNDYLFSKNITPIIGGDQLLSKQLAKKNNPVGYPADKRFENYSFVHGVYPLRQSKTDLIEFVKDIKNRDKIIVADWHYENETEYPSVDYLNWLGFKEIIPMTWYKEANMKYFSKYAQQRGSKRMIASVWQYFYWPRVHHLLWPVVDNSIVYFNNPDMEIPEKPHITVSKNGKQTISAKPGETIKINISPQGESTVFELYPALSMLRKDVIEIKGPEWKIPENAKEGLWTIQGYSKRKDGYLLHGMLGAGLYIGKKELPEKDKDRKSGAFISADFSNCTSLPKNEKQIMLNGSSSEINFGMIEGDALIKNGALICRHGGIQVGCLSSNSVCDTLQNDKTVMLEFSIDMLPEEDEQKWVGLLTWGCFGSGFRVILCHKKVYVQIFGDKDQQEQVRLISKKNLETGKKYFLVFNVGNGQATLYLNGVEQMKKAIDFSSTIPVMICPLCVGCSPKMSMGICKGIERYFDGRIYRFAIWDKYLDEKIVSGMSK